MAKIPTYQSQPQGLGGTTKLSGSDPVNAALQQLGGQMQNLGQAVKKRDDMRNALKSDADRSNFRTWYTENNGQLQNEIQNEIQTQQLSPEMAPAEYDRRFQERYSEYLGDSDFQDADKEYSRQYFQENHAKNNVSMRFAAENRIDERNIATMQAEAQSHYRFGDIEFGDEVIRNLAGYIGEDKAIEFRTTTLKKVQDEEINASMMLNVNNTIQQLESGEWDLSDEERRSWISTAQTQRNKVWSANGTAITGRLLSVIYGEPMVEGDTLDAVSNDAQTAFNSGALSPEVMDKTMKRVAAPYEKTKAPPMEPELMADLMTRIGQYNPAEDPTRDQFAKLNAEVNAVENPRDFAQANQLFNLVEKGGVASVHWNDVNQVIEQDMAPDMFGDTIITAKTGLLAKQEVAQFLRENPNDMDGAIKLYDAIKANDQKTHSKKFYQKRYGYGGGAYKARQLDVRIGQVMNGYKYIGGDKGSASSWEKVD